MTEGGITVSRAVPEQAAAIAALVDRLLREMGGGPSGLDQETARDQCRAWLRGDPGYAAFVACDAEGTPVGLVSVYDLAVLYVGGRMGVISELYVEPAYRRRGLGKRLMRAVYAFGRERAWRRIEVSAPEVEEQPGTVAFYEAEGFWLKGPLMARRLER